jgi:hypothetical protein
MLYQAAVSAFSSPRLGILPANSQWRIRPCQQLEPWLVVMLFHLPHICLRKSVSACKTGHLSSLIQMSGLSEFRSSSAMSVHHRSAPAMKFCKANSCQSRRNKQVALCSSAATTRLIMKPDNAAVSHCFLVCYHEVSQLLQLQVRSTSCPCYTEAS